MQLLYVSPVPWESFAQRPHKFVEWFRSKTNDDVLWINPYPTRFPKLSDFRRLPRIGEPQKLQMPSWLKVIQPNACPIEPLPASGHLNKLLWNRLLRDIEHFASRAETLVAVGKPSAFALVVLERLRGLTFVYDAMDDFPAFYSGLARSTMASKEKRLAGRVTRLFVSSTALQQRWKRVRNDVQLVRNGLDATTLPAPRSRPRQQNSKVLGYVGTIGQWFDWEWIIALARARRNDSVQLIGPSFSPPPRALPQNIELFPARPHTDALNAMLDFDVGLIPFKRNELTASVDPIKYYEYRALGLPVVSTDFGEMSLRANEEGTFIINEATHIGDLINTAVLYSPEPEAILQFIANNTWEARFGAASIF